MDRRVRKTKTSIRELLLKLMEEDEPQKITVTEICNILDINRSTFYCHYESIEDVLEEIEDELMEDIREKVNRNSRNDLNSLLPEVSGSIYSNRKIYQILSARYSTHFSQKLNTTISDLLSVGSRHQRWNPGLEHSLEYVHSFMVSGIIGLLFEWLKFDCTDSIPTVSKELEKYFAASVRK